MTHAGAESRSAEIAYETIAPVYDEFTAHHDYEVVMAELLPALEQRGLTTGSLLDVGCGTGKSFLPMLARGWEVTACDISPAMVALAREKVDNSVRVEIADMRELSVFGEFDLVWAVDDAINYLLDFAELTAALTGMRDNLAPAGLLQFDVNTLLMYRSALD
jgi:SAM-dependent methyltransferase